MMTFNELRKNLKKDTSHFNKTKLAILGQSATQLLVKAIKGYGIEEKIDIDIYEADYNTRALEISNPNSGLYYHKSNFILITENNFYLQKQFWDLDVTARTTYGDDLGKAISLNVQALNANTDAHILLCTVPIQQDLVFGNFANSISNSYRHQIRVYNLQLSTLAQENNNITLIDLEAIAAYYGYNEVFSQKNYVLNDFIYQLDFLPVIAQNITQVIESKLGRFKKCLILDLDNTTWGGIIGDDGIEGIQIGDYGIGKAFTALQLWAKNLKQRGIILAICSKNTDHIAKEPFEKHPDMVLRLEDISIFVANWESKADNIRYIKEVLNIGFDSMVFLDDNPFERNLIRTEIPEVTVPELPKDPAEYLNSLRSLNLFETASYTALDEERTTKYQEEAKRAGLKQQFTSIDGFLESLDMTAIVEGLTTFNMPRVAQLTQRSNQFNLRTIRYSEAEVAQLKESKDYTTFNLTLSDKYGKYGLVSIIILQLRTDALFIDTWIMSCRVLKRGVENYMMNEVVKFAVTNKYAKIIGEYLPTKKNGIVKDHYHNLGFEKRDGLWILGVNNYKPFPTYIQSSKLITQ